MIDEAEVRSVNEAASWSTDRIMEFHRRHGADPLIPEDQMYTHQQLLILNRQNEYRVDLVDDATGCVTNSLRLAFRYTRGLGGWRKHG